MPINTTGLLPPQFSHTERLVDSLNKNGFAMDMSETGTGKTYAAAAVIREMNVPALIICPKSVVTQWQRIIDKFGVTAYIVNYELLCRGNTRYMKWKKMPDPLSPWNEKKAAELPFFKIPANYLVVVDEAHKCKGADTSNSWMLVALKLQNYKTLLCSATMATTPLEMKALGFVAGLHRLYNFNDFCRLHGAKWMARWGAMEFNMNDPEAKRSMMNLHRYFFKEAKCASRLTCDDFSHLFPDNHVVAEAYNLGSDESKIQSVYDQMEYELARLDERCENYSEHILAIIMEARRRAELCKVPIFVEMIEEAFDEGKNVVCFLNFNDTVSAVIKRLHGKKYEGKIGYIVGGQTSEERQNDIDDFNADKKRILIANIAAGGVGVSLHDLTGNHPRSTIISPNFSAFQLVQALGRVHRQGGKTKSYQRIVFAANTIEEQACRKVQARINNLSALNDSDLREGICMFSH